ncbi:MAG: hypothetical protein IT166_25170 [Bryobacterales bacterium]|nr:hypothetical protein [Bryobacterales bacterium]
MTETVTVSGEGKQIVIDFPSLGEALSLWKPWGDGKRRTEIAAALHETLAAAGLCLELRVQGKPVAMLGGEEMSGLALRLLSQAMR